MRKGTTMSDEAKVKIKLARARQIITKESNIKRSLKMTGVKKPTGFGGKVSLGRARRKKNLGYINSPETREKIGLAGIGRKASIKTKEKMSNSASGKNSIHWEGGITPLNLAIRITYKYSQWRSDVFTRDNFTCKRCFKKGVDIESHHLESFCSILKRNNIKSVEEALLCEELWDINNGETLCKDCHGETDNYKRKGTSLKNNI